MRYWMHTWLNYYTYLLGSDAIGHPRVRLVAYESLADERSVKALGQWAGVKLNAARFRVRNSETDTDFGDAYGQVGMACNDIYRKLTEYASVSGQSCRLDKAA